MTTIQIYDCLLKAEKKDKIAGTYVNISKQDSC